MLHSQVINARRDEIMSALVNLDVNEIADTGKGVVFIEFRTQETADAILAQGSIVGKNGKAYMTRRSAIKSAEDAENDAANRIGINDKLKESVDDLSALLSTKRYSEVLDLQLCLKRRVV